MLNTRLPKLVIFEYRCSLCDRLCIPRTHTNSTLQATVEEAQTDRRSVYQLVHGALARVGCCGLYAVIMCSVLNRQSNGKAGAQRDMYQQETPNTYYLESRKMRENIKLPLFPALLRLTAIVS